METFNERKETTTDFSQANYNFSGKTALVTGASRGIGRAIALLLAKQGANIIVNYHQSEKQASDVADEIRSFERNAYLYRADVSTLEDVTTMFKTIGNEIGSLDILVNNAGVHKKGYIKYFKTEDWDTVINGNMKSVYLCSKEAIKYLVKSDFPSIINIASVSAHYIIVGQAAYNASKAGVVSMTKTMAKEMGRLNIRVNAVSPGPVRTDLGPISEDEEKYINRVVPLRRIGLAEDVAHAVSFLCSPNARHITGQVLDVDGGMSL